MPFRSGLLSSLILITAYAGHSQTFVVEGTVADHQKVPISNVTIIIKHTNSGTTTDETGYFSLNGAIGDTLILNHIQYKRLEVPVVLEKLSIILDNDTTALSDIEIRETRLREKVVEGLSIDTRAARQLPSAFGDFNKILSTMPGVSANNELSSAYSVRGGNFDENLVYVNDIPIYRPFLSNAGRQEGLSFVNPQLVDNITFYPGGWEPKYGDKLSSSLNIEYKQPEKPEGAVTMGLLGGTAFAGGKQGRGSYLIGARYRDSRYLLNSLETKGQYFPTYTDIQSLLTFDLSNKKKRAINKTRLNWLLAYGRNRYLTKPTSQVTDFGSVTQNFRIETAFSGKEILNYNTYQTGFRLTHQVTDHVITHLIGSALYTNEDENYDVEGAYRLSDVDIKAGLSGVEKNITLRGLGSNYYYGRNKLEGHIYSLENRWEYTISGNVLLEGGLGIAYQKMDDVINEYSFVDSADYVSIFHTTFNELSIQSIQYTGYLQGTVSFRDSVNAIIAGARINYWGYSGQVLVSPRLTYRITPHWDQPTSFKLSAGYYQQPPFYRELRDYNGQINPSVTAQRSIHFITGFDRAFSFQDRPFLLNTNVYYKYLYDVIPYDIDNVRLRYYPSNNTKAYAAGIDFRINGEFIKGTQSWLSLSYLQTREDIPDDSRGYIRRPTDQHINMAIYFEDHMPNDPTLRVYLNLVFGSGYPFGPPRTPAFRNAFQGDEYYRADVGLSKIFALKNKWLSRFLVKAEVLNALGADNTLSYTWIEDVNGNHFAVPNSLSARFLNIKLTAEL